MVCRSCSPSFFSPDMTTCLILGDSLALGLGAALGLASPITCDVVAKVGAGADRIAQMQVPNRRYDVAVISVGSNDRSGAELGNAIKRIRSVTPARTIVWLLPYERRSARSIASFAMSHGDLLVDIGRFESLDGLHPRSYRSLAITLRHRRP